MPGMTTSGSPLPRSIISISVPERLASLQCVLNPLESLALAAELEHRLALEIEQILLAHGSRMGQRSAGHDERERAADQRVVVADSSGTPSQMEAELQRCQHRVAADEHVVR